ncbi:MAG: DUF3291 domain-containing protein [Flavobacteriales bacterium]
MKIISQLKRTTCVEYRSTGFWTKHYTMSLWNNEEDLKAFARSGEHLEAMKHSKEIARVIRTYTYDSDALPSWKEGKNLLLEKGKVLTFK